MSCVDKNKEEIKRKLQKLEEEIAETKRRLPAHSIKPPIMIELLDLEDRFDELFRQLKQLERSEK